MDSRNSKNLRGLDISKWQGNVDFNKIKAAGYSIVILKATEGATFIDPNFETNHAKALNAGLKLGAYHFMGEKSAPAEQAKHFWNTIKDNKIHVYPVLDVESDKEGRGAKVVTDRCLEFLGEFKKLSGYDCIVYTYTSFANTSLDSRLKNYKLWIAHYGVSTPGTNKVWSNWSGFQYTDKESAPGVASPCDANEFKPDILIESKTQTPAPTPSPKPTLKLSEISISGDEVKSLQSELNKLGAKLTVDGLFGDMTLGASKTLKQGDQGPLVTLIQNRLMKKGYSLAPYGATGYFGELTNRAVKELQSKNGISSDGVIAQSTWKVLYSK